MTVVDRDTRCNLARKVSHRCSSYEFQEMVAHSVQGHDCYSDDYHGYKTVLYSPASHHPMGDKSQTYSVEGSNADRRHDLARLRSRSRCFSRKIETLRNAFKLFVHAYNQRQLYKHRFPTCNPPLMSFASP